MENTLKEFCNDYFIELDKYIEYNIISLNNIKNPEKYNFISNLATALYPIEVSIKKNLEILKNLTQYPIEFYETLNRMIEICDKFIGLLQEFKELYKDKQVEIFSPQKNNVISTKNKCLELKKAYYNRMSPITRKKLDEIEEKNNQNIKSLKRC